MDGTNYNTELTIVMKKQRGDESLVFNLEKVSLRKDRRPGFRCLQLIESPDGEVKVIPRTSWLEIEEEGPPQHVLSAMKSLGLGLSAAAYRINTHSDGGAECSVIENEFQSYRAVEVFLDQAVTPLLRNNEGQCWEINSDLSFFKFQSEDNTGNFNMSIGRAEMINCVGRLQPALRKLIDADAALDDNGTTTKTTAKTTATKGSKVQKLIIDDIKLARNQRLIDFEEAVRSSLVIFDGSPPSFEHPTEIMNKQIITEQIMNEQLKRTEWSTTASSSSSSVLSSSSSSSSPLSSLPSSLSSLYVPNRLRVEYPTKVKEKQQSNSNASESVQ